MTEIIELNKVRLDAAVSRGYRNWKSRYKEDFGLQTLLSHISLKTLISLAQAHNRDTFYLYDLIMNLQNLGSGFEFNELASKDKIAVIDRYLFLIDRIRFEYMKRLGWVESYPGEESTLVELIINFDRLGPGLQTRIPSLSRDHPAYEKFRTMNAFEKEEYIRKLIPKALQKIKDQSTTL